MYHRLPLILAFFHFSIFAYSQENEKKYKQQWHAITDSNKQVVKYIFFDDFEKNANLWSEGENEFHKYALDLKQQHFLLHAMAPAGTVFPVFKDTVTSKVIKSHILNKDFSLEADLLSTDKEKNHFGIALELSNTIPSMKADHATYIFLISEKGEAKIQLVKNTHNNIDLLNALHTPKIPEEIINIPIQNLKEEINHIKIKKEGNRLEFLINGLKIHAFKTEKINFSNWYFLTSGKKKFAIDNLKWVAVNTAVSDKIKPYKSDKQPVLSENFNDNLKEWEFLDETDVNKGILPVDGNNVYSISSSNSNQSMSYIGAHFNVNKDFLISCNTYWVNGNDSEMYGLQLGKDAKNKVFFMISANGHVTIEVVTDNVKQVMLPSDKQITKSFSPHINTYGLNQIVIKRVETHSGAKAYLYINGKEVGSIPAEFQPDADFVGFVLSGPQTVYFDDLYVYGTAINTTDQSSEKKNTAIAITDSIESSFMKIKVDPRWRKFPSNMYTKVDNGLAFSMEAENMEAQLTFPLSEKNYRLTNFLLFLDTTAANTFEKAKAKAIDRLLMVSGKADKPQSREEQIKELGIREEPFTTTQGKQGILLYADYLHEWTGLKQFSTSAIVSTKNKNMYAIAFMELRGFHKSNPDDKKPQLFLRAEDRKTYWGFTKNIMKTLEER